MTFRPSGGHFQVRVKNVKVISKNMFVTVEIVLNSFNCVKHIYLQRGRNNMDFYRKFLS